MTDQRISDAFLEIEKGFKKIDSFYKKLFFIITVVFIGLHIFLSAVHIFPSLEVDVDPEYISGMLTASNILFGFWILLIQRHYENDNILIRKLEKTFTIIPFVYNIIFFTISVVYIYLSALFVLPSALALSFLVNSFLTNALSMIYELTIMDRDYKIACLKLKQDQEK